MAILLQKDIKRVDWRYRRSCFVLARRYNIPLKPLRFKNPGSSYIYNSFVIDVPLIDKILKFVKKEKYGNFYQNIRTMKEIKNFLLYDKPFSTLDLPTEEGIAHIPRGMFSSMRTGRPSLFRSFCILGKGSPGKGYLLLKKDYQRCLNLINDYGSTFPTIKDFTIFVNCNILTDISHTMCKNILVKIEEDPPLHKPIYRRARKIARFLESNINK